MQLQGVSGPGETTEFNDVNKNIHQFQHVRAHHLTPQKIFLPK
jgi:hypothetical protein